jgi:hypothetical protein
MKRFALVSCIGLLAFSVADAQETHKFTADFGGGFTVSVGNTAAIWIMDGTFAAVSATIFPRTWAPISTSGLTRWTSTVQL